MLFLGMLGLLMGTVGQAGEDARAPGSVRIGMLGDLLKEVPDALLAAMQQPFGTVMTQQTGLTGELVRCGDATTWPSNLPTTRSSSASSMESISPGSGGSTQA